jgi:hypothetical protein
VRGAEVIGIVSTSFLPGESFGIPLQEVERPVQARTPRP